MIYSHDMCMSKSQVIVCYRSLRLWMDVYIMLEVVASPYHPASLSQFYVYCSTNLALDQGVHQTDTDRQFACLITCSDKQTVFQPLLKQTIYCSVCRLSAVCGVNVTAATTGSSGGRVCLAGHGALRREPRVPPA
jgi:hypothetical protein